MVREATQDSLGLGHYLPDVSGYRQPFAADAKYRTLKHAIESIAPVRSMRPRPAIDYGV